MPKATPADLARQIDQILAALAEVRADMAVVIAHAERIGVSLRLMADALRALDQAPPATWERQ